ncbi:DUF4129 domain-containing protein [Paraliomyxa miuraensis]|uniref:DUF4129 domain-containing protein n=1 Tax=Paraliomyxa miuraensis TaxID=376150 RepID=UPI002251BB8B|nr:DUF4129 domain-containing protein [Paraliomyxa miuraensis]MCX4243952.1 DUF4129 domain-containing protein [Paraliomyxa miuraensis]
MREAARVFRTRRRRVGIGLAILVGLTMAAKTAAAEPRTARQVLANDAFGFCHDERYPLTEEEARWCPLLPTEDPPCPAFAAACGAPRAVEGTAGPWRQRRAGQQGTEEDDAEKPRERGPDDFQRQKSEPAAIPDSGLGPLAHVLLWVIVVLMVIVVLAQFRGTLGPSRKDVPDGPKPDEAEDRPDVPPATLEPDLTDVDRLLARAVARAERGELEAAVADGHAALVRRLAERGHIRLHASRTNGDHVRDLRGEPALQQPTRAVMRIVERVQFGHAPISRTDVDRLIAQVRTVLGTVAGAVLLLWTALACTAEGLERTKEYPWSHSPSGTAGVLELLRSYGMEIEYRKSTLDRDHAHGDHGDHGQGLAGRTPIVLDQAALDDAEWSALLRHVRAGGNAVVATRERLPPELEVEHVEREGDVLEPYGGLLEGESTRLAVPGHEGLSMGGDVDGYPLWVDAAGTPYAVVRLMGEGTIIVLADDRLLTNGALAIPGHDTMLVELLRGLPRLELVDGGLRSMTAEGGAKNPFDAMSRAHLTPVILQLLLLVLLLYLWRGVHFGRPRDPPPPSRRRFVEHVDALAQQYHRAGARRHALRLYVGWALDRVQERLGGRRRGLHHLAHRIATRTGRDETEIMRILVEAHDARDVSHQARESGQDDSAGYGSEDDLRVLRELGQLVDVTRATPKGKA